MSEKTKIAVVIMLGIIAVYICWMIAFPVETVDETQNNVQSGEVSTENEDLMYTITRVSDSQLNLSTVNEYTRTTTQYFFENDVVSNIIVTEEVLSGDLADKIYEGIQANEELSQIYDDIKVEGNIITMTLKEDYVNVYAGLKYEELYEQLTNSLKISAE